jgi:hypothetical protein
VIPLKLALKYCSSPSSFFCDSTVSEINNSDTAIVEDLAKILIPVGFKFSATR